MELRNGRYEVEGVGLVELANEYGTPLYVYSGQKILDQFKTLSVAA
jgi:diaminopimelate decarboxylase